MQVNASSVIICTQNKEIQKAMKKLKYEIDLTKELPLIKIIKIMRKAGIKTDWIPMKNDQEETIFMKNGEEAGPQSSVDLYRPLLAMCLLFILENHPEIKISKEAPGFVVNCTACKSIDTTLFRAILKTVKYTSKNE